jgi:hypothetical protein
MTRENLRPQTGEEGNPSSLLPSLGNPWLGFQVYIPTPPYTQLPVSMLPQGMVCREWAAVQRAQVIGWQ